MAVQWIKSAGGPLIVMPEGLTAQWRGISGNSSILQGRTDQTTDYERACRLKCYVGLIDVSDEVALVLGDMPLATTVLSDGNGTTFLVRAFYMDSNDSIQVLLNETKYLYFGKVIESIDVVFSSNAFLIFDSALYGTRIYIENISFSVPIGRYRIQTFAFEPHVRASFLLHKFEFLSP